MNVASILVYVENQVCTYLRSIQVLFFRLTYKNNKVDRSIHGQAAGQIRRHTDTEIYRHIEKR
jgi:hypothetical protein